MRNIRVFVIALISGLIVFSAISYSQTVYKFNDGLDKAKSLKKKGFD